MANILIIGGGFSGVVAAEKLAERLSPEHQITLVAPNKKFVFYPALVELAFGECETADISFDLAAKLSSIGVRFVHGELLHINHGRRRAEIAGDDVTGEISYDFLVLALGRRLATEKVPGFFEHSHHLLGVNAALRFGEAVRTFSRGEIVLGLCPGGRLPVPVCEAAFALARKFEAGTKAGTVNIKVIFPESLEAAFGGASLHRELEAAFAKHRINVLYNVPITEVSESEVLSSEKHRIKHDLLMLVPPFRGAAILEGMGATDAENFVKVDGQMRIAGIGQAYAAGDLVAFSGPKFAHMAVRQAEIAAGNILEELAGNEPNHEYYHEIATIIDAGGAGSIYLHYGVWDDYLYNLKQGGFWSWAKQAHDALWRSKHKP